MHPCGEPSLCLVPDEHTPWPGVLDSPERQNHCFRAARLQSCLPKTGPNVLHPKAGTLA